MVSDTIIVLLALSNVINALGSENSFGVGDGKNEYYGKETLLPKKVKRWAPGFQDIAIDYPEFDDPYSENQLEVLRPFSTSPSSALLYHRPGSRRPSGAVTRTVFNPPSGFIPRVFAAAKAAIATLTGPQTVLSRTTYLQPPRPAITALHVPHVTETDNKTPSTNAAAAAAAAAAAVAAITRSMYEAPGQRGTGFYEKDSYLPMTAYNSYGAWPEPSRSPWTSLQPPDITFRIPYDGWTDRGRPHLTDSYGPPPPIWSKTNYNPAITIEASRNPWSETTYNKIPHGQDAWNNYRNQWIDYDQNHRGFVQNRVKDLWPDDKLQRTSYGRGPGGYASATADTPPNGDSFADAKITANGASAVAAAVWNLGGITARGSTRTKTENRQDLAEDDFGRESKQLGEGQQEKFGSGQFSGKMDVDDTLTEKDKDPASQCGHDGKCRLSKSNLKRLRGLFPSRRKS